MEKEENQLRVKFKPVSYSRDIMAEDPGVRRQTLARRVKMKMTTEDATARREQAEALPLQGQLLRDSSSASDFVWATAVSTLDSEVLKFALNSATDTLPHNSNLAKWNKGIHSNTCKLCGKNQSLLHVLNNCEVALKCRRYNRRHDQVLGVIVAMTQSYLPDTYQLTADLTTSYNFPHHIVATNLRPDLVVWSDVKKRLYIVELTICYETGFYEASERKMKRYVHFEEEAERNGYHTEILPIQVGSRGVLDESLETLRNTLKPIPTKMWQAFLKDVIVVTLIESHHIWCRRNQTE